MKTYRLGLIKLSESFVIGPDGISDDVQILRAGNFFHEGKTVPVSKADLKKMVSNFENGVRGIDLSIDFSHNSEGEAAAWFENVYLSEDGKELWAKVDWTADGAEAVKQKKFRYLSADFNFYYKDNETLQEHGPTLLGAGLTNRPVVKKMNPTILSENSYNEDDRMNFEEKLKESESRNKKLAEELAHLKDEFKKDKDKDEDKRFSEREADLKKREGDIKLAEEKSVQDKKDAEKKTVFDTMLSEGKAVEAQRDAFMKDDMADFVKNAAKAGDMNFSEKGNGDNGGTNEHNDSTTPAQDEVISLAEKKVTEDKVSFSEATSIVLNENSVLRAKYEKETES